MNDKLNIQNLIDLFAQKQGVPPKEVEEFVKTFFALIEEGLERDRYVKIKKWGTFKLIDVDSRESVDVNTGERIEIQGHTKVSFTPDSSLKEVINRPFAHFETVILNENTVLEDTPLEEENEGDADRMAEGEFLAEQAESVETRPEEMNGPKEEHQPEKEGKLTEEEIRTIEKEYKTVEMEEVSKPKDNSMKYFITLAVLIIVICGGVILFIYNPDFFVRPVPPSEETLHISENQDQPALQLDSLLLKADSVQTDSLPMNTVRDVSEETSVRTNTADPVQEEVKRPVVASRPSKAFKTDSTSYEIVGTETKHTIVAGETLTRVALKYYGTKALWPYLVKHNPDVIKNPDNVPSGTVIKIPRLKKKK